MPSLSGTCYLMARRFCIVKTVVRSTVGIIKWKTRQQLPLETLHVCVHACVRVCVHVCVHVRARLCAYVRAARGCAYQSSPPREMQLGVWGTSQGPKARMQGKSPNVLRVRTARAPILQPARPHPNRFQVKMDNPPPPPAPPHGQHLRPQGAHARTRWPCKDTAQRVPNEGCKTPKTTAHPPAPKPASTEN